MKQILVLAIAFLSIVSCHKKNQESDMSNLLIGTKWSCNSYKKYDADSVRNLKAYSLSGRYDYGWEFLENKHIKYKNGLCWMTVENDYYEVIENKKLILTQESSVYEYDIISFSSNKLTIYSPNWKTTFYLLRE